MIIIAIGTNAGVTCQQNFSVAIGANAGRFYQQEYSVAIGYGSGLSSQGKESVVIGYNSGVTGQANKSIIIGSNSNNSPTAENSITVGNNSNTDANLVAIGYSIKTNSQTGCIVLCSDPSSVTCTSSNQLVLAGVKTTDPSPGGTMPVTERLPFAGGTGGNVWLPIQIGSKMYCIPIYPD